MERFVRKIIFLFLVFLVFIIGSSLISSGIKIWPGTYDIDINRWPNNNEKVDTATIQVTNTESYDINVTIRVDHPASETITEGYSFIPHLSWVRIVPEVLYVPAGSSDELEIFIEVPESEQSSHYNEKWETLVVITPPVKKGQGINFQTELAVKLFINTPKEEFAQIQYIYILFFTFISIIIVLIAFIHARKKKGISAKNKKP
jgi:hypothetical protein